MWSIILTILHILAYPYVAGMFFTAGMVVGSDKFKDFEDKLDYAIGLFFCIIWPLTLLAVNEKTKHWMEVQMDKADAALNKWQDNCKHRKTDKRMFMYHFTF